MNKTQEQRIKDAVAVLRSAGVQPMSTYQLACDVLEAADREPPEWPTDESCKAVQAVIAERLHGYLGTDSRKIARAALLADPIIKAAIHYRDFRADLGRPVSSPARQLVNAVNEAGL